MLTWHLTKAPIDIVLVGGGHAHVLALLSFGRVPIAGARVTLIAKEVSAAYSGMLPGFVGGHYELEACQIDLARLCKFAGVRLISGAAVDIDRANRRIITDDGSFVSYDLLSIDVGITPDLRDITGAEEHAIAVKPVSVFAPKWQALEQHALQAGGPRRIAVIGGGAAGVELVLAAHHRFSKTDFAQARASEAFSFTLIAGGEVLPGHNSRAQALARAALANSAIDVIENDLSRAITAHSIELASGRSVAADAVLISTKAMAAPWLAATDLPKDSGGFLATRPTLQLLDDDAVFAVGDCATIIESPRPKAGVFAVRQGAVVAGNLRELAQGRNPCPYVPQTQYLSLISLGKKSAIASRGAFSASGAWAWWLKDRIDRGFVDQFDL